MRIFLWYFELFGRFGTFGIEIAASVLIYTLVFIGFLAWGTLKGILRRK